MPTQKPIFLFAFANDKGVTLSLGKEEEAARKALTAPHVSSCIEYKNLGQASMDEIYRNFSQNLGRIAVFHYGGHSDDQFLNLADTNARASSLSTLMGMEENLQLVFLNGCNNNGQVEELRKKNVKAAIIATLVKIDDNRALAFCEKFYQTLAGGAEEMTIRKAFDVAKSYLENDSTERSQSHRGIELPAQEDSGKFEWELHLPPDGDAADWAIPGPPQEQEGTKSFEEEVELSVKNKNKNLMGWAFGIGKDEGILKYRPEFSEDAENFKKAPGDPECFFKLRDDFFDAFPSVLSRQIEDLFTPPGMGKGRLRLKELNEAYLTLGRLLCGIALSSLWEAAFDPATLKPRKDFVIREEYKNDIRDFLYPPSPAAAEGYDYFWLIATVNRIFQNPGNKDFKPYVPELASLFQSLAEETPYYKAYRFLEQELRHRLRDNIAKEEVEGLCNHAELHLGRLLQKCAFLSAYELITVKDVTVYQPRQQPEAVFYHNQFTLKGQSASNRTNSYTLLDREQAINNNSIYLAREFKKELRPLNLSPFLIDENAFKEKSEIKLPKIHFFKGQEGEGQLHYVHAEEPQNSLVIRKETSRDDDDFSSWDSEEEKFIVENYSTKGGKREKEKNQNNKNQNYKTEDLKVLFEQLKLFKKAIGI